MIKMSFVLLVVLQLTVSVPVLADRTIHKEKSLYRNIVVKEKRGQRCLLFSVKREQRNQTCMDLEDPRRIVFPYVRMTFAGLLVTPEPSRTLMIGLGGGTISNVLRENSAKAHQALGNDVHRLMKAAHGLGGD